MKALFVGGPLDGEEREILPAKTVLTAMAPGYYELTGTRSDTAAEFTWRELCER